ncbi:hypothetical protein Sango_1974400 [Sesamum angolense]|uniref:Uncharacterized protein n=1 Tax=Sesamum angolense TaxID=2727404 RepID=A0AAE1WF67_9LAMI|nr:hypothetical protein Sango_1974400 [Sesamum angolense]
MGCNVSCKRLSPSSKQSKTKTNIRVVHLNGYIEERSHPVTVAQVTGKPPQHFLFTQAQLLAAASTPMKPDVLLEPGRVYFLLPYTLFASNVSPNDLAPVARKLASMAQNSLSKSKSKKAASGNSPVWSSPAASPNRLVSDQSNIITDNEQVLSGVQSSSKSRSWKPLLATIREISFQRMSESEVQEHVKVDGAQ